MAPSKVSYFYDDEISTFSYGRNHLMKPFRVAMTHTLVTHYGLHRTMNMFRPMPASAREMTSYHTDDYIKFLEKVTPETIDTYLYQQGDDFGIGDDCPIWDGLFNFCSISAGGSLEGAAKLNQKSSDIAINWSGGLHHATKGSASGFCYVNDIVLGILELLRVHKRVLYIDIDVHHGDGVEEAFFTTDRVMCLSLHNYGEFFPGTGHLLDTGVGKGKYHSINVPLRYGMDDASYASIFNPILDAIIQHYDPEAIVLQCGADSLSGDRLGPFNLSMSGHAQCIAYTQSKNLPTLVLGGGGYTIKNVSRTWAKETGVLLKQEMSPDIPYNQYYEHFGPDFDLDVRAGNMDNLNSQQYLGAILERILSHLREITGVPSVQLTDIPTGLLGDYEESEAMRDDEEEDCNPDVRTTKRRLDKMTEDELELMESDEDFQVIEAAYNLVPAGKRQRGIRERNRTDRERDNTAGATVVADNEKRDSAVMFTDTLAARNSPSETGTSVMDTDSQYQEED